MRWYLVALVIVVAARPGRSQPSELEPSQQFLGFIKAQADQLRKNDRPPATRAEWESRRDKLRRELERAWGGFPAKGCPLEPRVLGVVKREGYRIEKLIFQSRPDVWMTANAYVPAEAGHHPAILMVHGHWRGARLDPVVQRRCLGAVRRGFFVLAVDAFGAGERALGTKLGEYHGEMVAATLLPVGLPLSGLQVYENMHAVDYLRTRPEVDSTRIGITGASGGGNQTMYAGAWDDRFGAAVPVCSVGNYQAYLGAACCMCEVVPGALRFAEESDILGMTAPRGLLVINATRDAFQFSVGEARKSLAGASAIYRLYDRAGQVRHAIFDSPHDYSQAMREAMYGWMTHCLSDVGDGRPLYEPELKTEDPETIRCYPGDSRPSDWMTIPRFAAAEARKLLAARTTPVDSSAWLGEAKRRRAALTDRVLGGIPPRTPLELKVTPDADGQGRTLVFHPEPGLTLTAHQHFGRQGNKEKVAIALDLDGADKAAAHPLAQALRQAGWSVLTIDLRATGKLAWPRDRVGRAPDHNTAEWSLWVGRPLLGQWSWDIRRLLDALAEADSALPRQLALIGRGPAGVAALTAAAADDRIQRVAAIDALASYVTDVPYQGQRLGLMAPGILREVGDVPHLAALAAPRRVVIAGGVHGNDTRLTPAECRDAFSFAAAIWRMLGASDELKVVDSSEPMALVQALE